MYVAGAWKFRSAAPRFCRPATERAVRPAALGRRVRQAPSNAQPVSSIVEDVSSTDDPAKAISLSLKQLQHAASNLNAEPTVDGLLTAFQQLSLIQQQLQQEARACKISLHRAHRDCLRSRATAGATAAAAAEAAADDAARVQLSALTQLRVSAVDAQDFLLSLVQQLLQVSHTPLCTRDRA